MSGSETAPLTIAPGVIGQMATALQARLQSVFPPAKRFGFQIMPAQLTPGEWEAIANTAPFVGLGWKGLPSARLHDNEFVGEAHWVVFLVVKNATSVAARFAGDALGIGLWRMVQSTIAILNGYTIPGVGACYATGAGNMSAEGWNATGCAIAQVDVSVLCTINAEDVLDFGVVPALNEEVTTWTASPSGEVLIVDDQLEGSGS